MRLVGTIASIVAITKPDLSMKECEDRDIIKLYKNLKVELRSELVATAIVPTKLTV
jgi:hypothetical protein